MVIPRVPGFEKQTLVGQSGGAAGAVFADLHGVGETVVSQVADEDERCGGAGDEAEFEPTDGGGGEPDAGAVRATPARVRARRVGWSRFTAIHRAISRQISPEFRIGTNPVEDRVDLRRVHGGIVEPMEITGPAQRRYTVQDGAAAR